MNEPEERSPYRYVGWVTGLGTTMVACIVIGLYLGIVVDKKLNTSPWFSFSLLVLGMCAGGWIIYKGIIAELNKDSRRE